MKKILYIELNNKLKSPLTYGFLVLSILLFLLFETVTPDVYSFSATIFIETMLVTMFIYGVRRSEYLEPGMRKKISSVKINEYKIIGSILIIESVYMLLVILLPMIILLFQNNSLSWLNDRKYSILIDDVLLNNLQLNGLNKDYILFTTNIFTMFQFLFSITILFLSTIMFVEIVVRITKTTAIYYSLIITILILLIITSDLFVKNIYLLTNDTYTLNSEIILNPFWSMVKMINPFYWINQMLMNSIIADAGSGEWMNGASAIEGASGLFNTEVYSIFHFGSSVQNGLSYNRPINLENIIIQQIVGLFYPISFTVCTTFFVIYILEVSR